MTFEEMAKARYSVRKYSDKKVEDEKLRKILEVANLAPTAPHPPRGRIYVLKSDEAMNKIKGLTRCSYGAPVALLFAYEESEAFCYPNQEVLNSGAEDCSIVATHVMFEALEQGLSTCWVNVFTPSEVEKAFHLPPTEHAVLLMDLGYEAEGNTPAPRHGEKKALREIVRVL